MQPDQTAALTAEVANLSLHEPEDEGSSLSPTHGTAHQLHSSPHATVYSSKTWAGVRGTAHSSSALDSDEGSDSDSSTANHSISPMVLRRPDGIGDTAWKRLRNRTLLGKMLELETPTITDKMIEFLMYDGVCECFVSFITQVRSCSLPAHCICKLRAL